MFALFVSGCEIQKCFFIEKHFSEKRKKKSYIPCEVYPYNEMLLGFDLL